MEKSKSLVLGENLIIIDIQKLSLGGNFKF